MGKFTNKQKKKKKETCHFFKEKMENVSIILGISETFKIFKIIRNFWGNKRSVIVQNTLETLWDIIIRKRSTVSLQLSLELQTVIINCLILYPVHK